MLQTTTSSTSTTPALPQGTPTPSFQMLSPAALCDWLKQTFDEFSKERATWELERTLLKVAPLFLLS